MSRFQVITFSAIAAAIAAALLLNEPARVIVIATLAVVYWTVFSIGMASIRMQYFAKAVCRGTTGQKRVALTFDDGPNPAATPALLDLLKAEQIAATFFCIGKHAGAHPQLAARIVAEGHLLGNHSYHHAWTMMFNRSPGLIREMSLAQNAIQQATGTTPAYFRPPIGLTNPHFTRALRALNLTMIGWDIRPMDTARPAQTVIDYVLKHARDGSIILLHDGGVKAEHVTHIVSTLVRELRSRGYSFERVDRLVEVQLH